jgi:prepilin-type N-terminal cleavage/methylation domain-containing protein
MKSFQLLPELKVLSRQGFTLLELIVTLAIFTIILSISLSSLDFYRAQLVKAEIIKLELNIKYLHKLAGLKNTQLKLHFNLKSNTYNFENETQHLNKNVIFDFLKGSYGPPSNPTKSINSACTFEDHQIIFEPNGRFSSGLIYLCDSKKKYMYALTTGVAKKQTVRKYQYSNNKWKLI